MNTRSLRSQKINRMTFVALFCAMSYICSVIFPIKVMFLTLDFKDAVSIMCGMFFGPSAGLFCAVVVPFVELITSDTGFYGLIMNILSSVTLVGISTLIYKYKKTIFGAVLGLVSAAFSTVAVMTFANLFITPFYMGVKTEDVIALIPKVILPFNVVKAILNAGISMLLYKPLSTLLKKMHVIRSLGEEVSKAENVKINKKNSVLVTVISGAIVIIAFVVLFAVLGGKLKK